MPSKREDQRCIGFVDEIDFNSDWKRLRGWLSDGYVIEVGPTPTAFAIWLVEMPAARPIIVVHKTLILATADYVPREHLGRVGFQLREDPLPDLASAVAQFKKLIGHAVSGMRNEVAALEAKIAEQQNEILIIQEELAGMQAYLSAADQLTPSPDGPVPEPVPKFPGELHWDEIGFP